MMTQRSIFLSPLCLYNKSMSESPDSTFEIDRDELTKAIIELNSMSPCDGVVMKKDGHVSVGYADDDETLCVLIPAAKLARQLTADGLASYSGKELKKWAENYAIEPLQQMVAQTVQ